MSSASQVTGLILAGGAGRRVGNRDKGLLLWRGKPLVEHVSSRLAPQVGKLLISCNRNASEYARYATTTVADARTDYQGPLAGLEAATALIDSEFVALACCDTPLIPEDLVARLWTSLATPTGDVAICFAHDGVRAQYLSALLHRSCLESLPAVLDSGLRAVRDWYALYPCREVDFSDRRECFRNLNELGRC